jgi:hypothetical protein
MARGFSQK